MRSVELFLSDRRRGAHRIRKRRRPGRRLVVELVAAPGATATIGAPAIAYGPFYQPAPQVVYPAPAYPVARRRTRWHPRTPQSSHRVVYPGAAVPYGGWSAPVYRAGPPAWGYGGPVMVAPHGPRHPRHHHHHRHHRH